MAACWHLFFSKVLPSVLTQDALPRCNGRLGSCSNLLLCGHAKAGSSRCRTCCCCNCLHSRCARSKVIRNAMERDWDATFLEREEVTRSGTTRTCCTDVWLAALVWLDAGDRAPSRLPSVVAARLSATWNGQAIQGKVIHSGIKKWPPGRLCGVRCQGGSRHCCLRHRNGKRLMLRL